MELLSNHYYANTDNVVNSGDLTLVSVIKQVVQGYNYRYTFSTNDNVMCSVTIWYQSWIPENTHTTEDGCIALLAPVLGKQLVTWCDPIVRLSMQHNC